MQRIKYNPSVRPPRILYVTAGAGGMICGSCLHDNALAGALLARGLDVILLPAYTPLRTDTVDHSTPRVVFGGINLYLRHAFRAWRTLPAWSTRWLDRPGVIRWLAANRIETNPARLGPLTLAMLQAERGPLAAEFHAFVQLVGEELRPDVVVFSNLLVAGSAPLLKARWGIPLVVTLQGDDLFVAGLPSAIRTTVAEEMTRIARSVDRFLVHSAYYAEHVARLLSLADESIFVIPLGLESAHLFTSGSLELTQRCQGSPTLGYLARLAPEKGLHVLCHAFVKLKQQSATRDCRLRIAGWHGPHLRPYLRESVEPIRAAGHMADVDLVGELNHEEKREFLRTLDVLSVPSPYADPKGLYVLESLATGVPVVQPRHGAFPELIGSTGGGLLFHPDRPGHLVEQLTALLTNRAEAQRLGAMGRDGVLARHCISHTADAAWTVLRGLVSDHAATAARPECGS